MEQSKVVTMRTKKDNDIEIALIQQELSVIKDNHLKHLKEDVEKIDKKVDKISDRLWWFAGIIIIATVGPLIGSLFT